MMQKRAGVLFPMLLLAASLAAAGCGRAPATASAAAPQTVTARLAVARAAAVPQFWQVVGTVRAAQTTEVAGRTMAAVVALHAGAGDRVRRGELLAELDDAQPRAAVGQAAAALAAATQAVAAAEVESRLSHSTLERYQRLYDKQSVSPQEFDQVQARFQAAEARRAMAEAERAQAGAALAQARTALDYTRVRAPFDGVVTDKKVDLGALVTPGMPLFTLEDTRHFRLEAAVDAAEVGRIHLGEAVPVSINGLAGENMPGRPDLPLTGRVSTIVPAADPASRSVLVKIALPAHAGLRSGLFGSAAFSRGVAAAVLIPAAAVVRQGELQEVFVVDGAGIASLRYITVGAPRTDPVHGAEVEVLSGLQAGERLVAAPQGRDLAGKRMTAAAPGAAAGRTARPPRGEI